MAASLEANKIVGAILTAGIIASASGNLARILYKPHELEEPIFKVAAAEQPATQSQPAPAEQPFSALLASADPENGAKIGRKCLACHTVDKGGKDKVGPNLWGIVGRPVASRPGFAYSDALRKLGGEWTYDRLFAFLRKPKDFVPGTKMGFAGLKKAEDRADVIAWLRTLADTPEPLPSAEQAAAEQPAAEQPAAEGTEAPAASAQEQAAAPAEEATGQAEQAAQAEQPAAKAEQAAQPEQAPASSNPVLAMLASADPEAGAKVARKCKACHSLEKGGPNKVGPNLWGVVGRPVASHEGYSYSDALKNMGGKWTFARLEKFLRDPRKAVPGTKMGFAGIKNDRDRANLLAFLRTLSDHPEPLP